MSTNQAQTFLNKPEVADIPSQPKGGFDPEKGRVPFVSALKLTYEQEQRMVDWALKRIEDIENEQGRNIVSGNADWFRSSSNIQIDRYTFMGRRSIWELNFQNKMWWRKFCLGGIFRDSNLTANFSRSIARQMQAQAIDYFFGTDPWFAAFPIGEDEEQLAEDIDEFSQFVSEKSMLKSALAQAIEGAVVRGESVLKTVYETEEQIYEQTANVLVDPDGKDILDFNGDWITDKDKFVDQMQSEVDPGPGPNAGKPIPGSKQPTGQRVLKKDQMTLEPQGGPQYMTKTIKRRKIGFKGARTQVVFWQDFLCPVMAPHVQRGGADIVIHLSDMPVIQLIDLYQRKGLLQESPSAALDETIKAINLLRNAAGGSGEPTAAVNQPRAPIGETLSPMYATNHEPKISVGECYMTFDANEDGYTEEICLVLDRKNRRAVFYDYLPNVTPDGERPFDVVRLQPIEGRWYGIGAMDMFEKSQRAIDLFFNRMNFSQSSAGRITFWKPSNTLEGDRNPNLPLNAGQTYTLKPEKTVEDTLAYVNLPEVKTDDLMKLLQLLNQIATSESGVSSANDAAIAGLDTSQLATGVRNIQQHNEVKSGLYISNLLVGLTSATKRNIRCEFANAQMEDVLRLFHGDWQKAETLLNEDLADLDFDIEIMLSKYHNQQLLASAQGAQNALAQFYQFPPQVQHIVAPLYVQSIKAFGFNDANALVVPLDEPLPQSALGPMPQSPPQSAPQAPAPVPDNAQEPQGPISNAPQIVPGKLLLNKPPSGS